MRMAQLSFAFRCVRRSLREHFRIHLLTAGTTVTALFIFAGFILIQENLHRLVTAWGDGVRMFAYLDERLAAAEVEPLAARVGAYPEIKDVRYVSQSEAWENFKKSAGAPSAALEGLSAEVLPASLEIAVKAGHRDRDALAGVAARLRAEKGVGKVEYPEEWLRKLSLLLVALEWAKWIFGGGLLLAALLIGGNTFKLARLARGEEIEIMQWAGAPPWLIRLPFVIEGMVQGIFGAALSVSFLWLLFLVATTQLPRASGLFAAGAELRFLEPESLAFILIFGWAIGTLEGLLSLRRWLKRW